MRVLMFGWEFPPHISGGLGTACYGLTKALLQLNVEVTFVVPRLFGDENLGSLFLIDAEHTNINLSDPESQKTLKYLNYIQVDSGLVPYTSLDEYYKQASTNLENEKNYIAKSFIHFNFSGHYGNDLIREVAQYAMVASKIAKTNQFDIIHAHDWLTYPAGIVAKKTSGKPLIVHVHATEYDRSGENINHIVYDIEKKGMDEADEIIAVSAFTKNILVNKYGISDKKISVVHNGVLSPNEDSSEIISIKKDHKIVSFLGRITFQKGPEYFVEAARMVLEKFPETHFVMAGSGDMMLRMIKRVAELKISSRFHFTGFLKYEDTRKIYAMSDVYVMPSVSEPFGITPLEAVQSGVPVIISKQSGVSEILKNAIKVNFWDVNALANAICSLLRHPSLSHKIALSGIREIQEMKWENAAFKVKEIYKSKLSLIN